MKTTGPVLIFLVTVFIPWDVYLNAPGLGISLTLLMAAFMLLYVASDFFMGRGPRVPFELAWPSLAIGLAVCFTPGLLWTGAGWIAIFLTTIHIARNRMNAAACLTGFSLSCTVAALWRLLAAQVAGAPPLYFAGNAASEALAITLGLIIACDGLMRALRNRRPAVGMGWTAAAIVMTASLFFLAAGCWDDGYAQAVAGDIWPETSRLIAGILGLWLTARVLAKLHFRPAVGDDRRGVFQALLLTGAAGCFLLGIPPGGLHAMLLGLAAAHVLPVRGETLKPSLRFRYEAWAGSTLFIALIAYNAGHVDPRNLRDPRNYDAQCQAASSVAELEAQLATLTAPVCYERRAALWQARAGLERAWLYPAARAFVRSTHPDAAVHETLPPPTEAERRDFLTRLRDACASAPDHARNIAYEIALAGSGQVDLAIESLAQRAGKRNTPPIDPAALKPLAQAMAWLLGNPSAASLIEDLPLEKSAAVFQHLGTQVFHASPDGVVPSGPVAVAAWAQRDHMACYASDGTFTLTHGRDLPGTAEVMDEPAWTLQNDVEGWALVLKNAKGEPAASFRSLGLGGYFMTLNNDGALGTGGPILGVLLPQ